jgi:hypothetical protein
MNKKGLSTEKVGSVRGRDNPARNKVGNKYDKLQGIRGAMSIRPRSMCPRPNFLGYCVPWILCP